MSGGGGGGDNKVEETQAQKEQSRIAIDRYNDYQQRFAPLENRLFGEVRTTDGEYEQGMGRAATASESQFSGARQDYDDQQFARGINPASGAYIARMGGLKQTEALATGQNAASSGQALADQEVSGLMGLTQVGRGQSTSAFQQYGQAAQSAQDQAISDARNALNESLSRQRFFGQATGAAAAGAQGLFSGGGTKNAGLTSVGSTVGYGDSARRGLDYSLSSSAGVSGSGLSF